MATWEVILEKRKNSLGDFHVFTDELLLNNIFINFSIEDLTQTIPFVSQVFYIFSSEEFLWKRLCLLKFGGDFLFQGSWKQTALTSQKQQREQEPHIGKYSPQIRVSGECY
jgi:hypothetical protein